MRYTLILVAFVALMIAAACGDPAVSQTEPDWTDDNPVQYENPYDNELIDIDFEIGGVKHTRKVKRGDYNTGRYKTFRQTTRPVTRTSSSSSSRPSTSSPSTSSPSRSTSSSPSRSSSSSSSRSSSSRSSSRR